MDDEIHTQNSVECLSMQLNIILKFISRAFCTILSPNKSQDELNKLMSMSKDLLDCETSCSVEHLCRIESSNSIVAIDNDIPSEPEFISHIDDVKLVS